MQALFSLLSLILQSHLQLEREISFSVLSALPGKFPSSSKMFYKHSLLLMPMKQVQFKVRANETKIVVLC